VLLRFHDTLLHSEFRQHLRICFIYGEQCVARIAIVWNRLAIRARVAPVVTSEASREVRVSQIVGISAPADLHFRKHVSRIDELQFAYSCIDQRALPAIQFGIRGPVEFVDAGCDALCRRLLSRVVPLQRLNPDFLDKRQICADRFLRQCQIDRLLRQLENMRGAIWQSMQSIVRGSPEATCC